MGRAAGSASSGRWRRPIGIVASVVAVFFAIDTFSVGDPASDLAAEVDRRIADARARLEGKAAATDDGRLPASERHGNAKCPRCGRKFVFAPKLRGYIRCRNCTNVIGALESMREARKSIVTPPTPEEEYARERKEIEDAKRLAERNRNIGEMRRADMRRDEEGRRRGQP